MYGVPQGDPNSGQPNNVVHGKAVFVGSATVLGSSSETFRGIVPEGVSTIWVSFVCGGAGGNPSQQGGSSGGFYMQPLKVSSGSRWECQMGCHSAPTGGTLGGSFVCSGNTLTVPFIPAGSFGAVATGIDATGQAITGQPGWLGGPNVVNPSVMGLFGAGAPDGSNGGQGILVVEW